MDPSIFIVRFSRKESVCATSPKFTNRVLFSQIESNTVMHDFAKFQQNQIANDKIVMHFGILVGVEMS